MRQQYRASYGCDCEGALDGRGRETPELTDGFLSAVEDFTGTRGIGCPWRAFDNPIVKLVLAAYEFFREGQLLAHTPYPSALLIRGLEFYHRALQRALAHKREIDRKANQ